MSSWEPPAWSMPVGAGPAADTAQAHRGRPWHGPSHIHISTPDSCQLQMRHVCLTWLSLSIRCPHAVVTMPCLWVRMPLSMAPGWGACEHGVHACMPHLGRAAPALLHGRPEQLVVVHLRRVVERGGGLAVVPRRHHHTLQPPLGQGSRQGGVTRQLLVQVLRVRALVLAPGGGVAGCRGNADRAQGMGSWGVSGSQCTV